MASAASSAGSNAPIHCGGIINNGAKTVISGQPRKPRFKQQRGGNPTFNAETLDKRSQEKKPQKQRPTHFLALPLHNHLELRNRVAAFQDALFDTESQVSCPIHSGEHAGNQRNRARRSSIVHGLDTSIVIDPVRIHMTLGVMALGPDEEGPDGETLPESSSFGRAQMPKKTVSTALALLNSLKPQIRDILGDQTVMRVPLEVLDILKSERLRQGENSNNNIDGREGMPEEKVGAGVLFLGPRTSPESQESDEKTIKSLAVCDFVHKAFKQAGYLTDTRPLKLHCTILNASHRRPRRWCPFSYTDIRSSKACDLISETQIRQLSSTATPLTHASSNSGGVGVAPAEYDQTIPPVNGVSKEQANSEPTGSRATLVKPPPLSVNLGAWDVGEIQIWVMGSRDGEGRYISSGSIKLG